MASAGGPLIVATLAMGVILALVGMTTDVGLIFEGRRQQQNAADAAALAGASSFPDAVQAIVRARDWASRNGFVDGEEGATVTVTTPYKGDASKIEVVVEKPVSAMFTRVLGMSAFSVTARAVATKPNAGLNAGVFALFAHGGSCSGDIVMSGGGNTIAGAVQANGDLTTSGSSGSNLTSLTGTVGCVCSLSSDNNTTITPAAVKGAPVDWPVYYTTGDFFCTFGGLTGPDVNLSDGTYWSSVTDPGFAHTLKPGVYCAAQKITGTLPQVDGAVTLVTGSSSGRIDISGGSTVLHAFTSNHVLAFSSSTDTKNAVVLNGGGSQWDGIIVAEVGGVSITGGRNQGGTAAGVLGAIMCERTITISGGASSIQAAYLPNPNDLGGASSLVE